MYRDFTQYFSYKCIYQTADPCDIKGKTDHAVIQLEFSQSCVKTTRGIQ